MTSKDNWREITVETNDEIWDRKEPIEGTLVDIKSDVGPNESFLYVLKTKDGKVSLWGSTVLDTKFAEIDNGSLVRIEPQGKVTSEKSGRTYQDFKVFVKPPEFKEVGGEPTRTDEDEPLPEPPF